MTAGRLPAGILLIAILVWAAGCGSSANAPTATTPGDLSNQSSTPPKLFLIVLENHEYSQVIGNPRLPFLNSLISTGAVADDYFANTHPSIGNYFMMTTGQIVTNDDSFTGAVSDNNLVRALTAAGKSWRVYAQSLPSAGFLGDKSGDYVKRHNPFAYFSDVINNSTQAANIVPFTQFTMDLSTRTTADLNYLLPDIAHDMHECAPNDMSCTMEQREMDADAFLQANVTLLMNDPEFQQRGLLIITFDESQSSDTTNGGGHVVTLFAGPRANLGHRSMALYQHQSLLNLMCQQLQCPSSPGAAATASPMSEFVK